MGWASRYLLRFLQDSAEMLLRYPFFWDKTSRSWVTGSRISLNAGEHTPKMQLFPRIKRRNVNQTFFLFCWLCISLQILGNNQLNTLFHVYIYFMSLQVSSVTVLIIRRSNFINISSGIISLCKWLLGMPVWPGYQAVTQINNTRWCINTIRSPDDECCDARNM
jgi:hypothetical protein